MNVMVLGQDKGCFVPEGWNRGRIYILYKDKGDPNDLANYRPLSMMNCGYKLQASILRNRITVRWQEPSVHIRTAFTRASDF